MHQTSAKELVEGNLKSVMKLVLALAAHFKPANIQQHSTSTRKFNTINTNFTNINLANQNSHMTANANLNQSSGSSAHHATLKQSHSLNPRNESITHLVQAACVSLSDVRRFNSKNDQFNVTYVKRENSLNLNESVNNKKFDETANTETTLNNESFECPAEITRDIDDMKKLLLNLQNLLLYGRDTEEGERGDATDDVSFEATTPEEQIIMLNSKIQQMEILCSDLKQELSSAKNENRQMTGVHSGLQTRMSDQDNTILTMKSEILQLNLSNEQLNKEKADFVGRLDEKNRMINDLKSELSSKNSTIDKMKNEIAHLTKEKEHAKYLKQQVKSFTDTLQIVKEKESTIAGLIACTDRKMNIIDKNLSNVNLAFPKRKCITLEEVNVLKDSITKLRSSFKPNHPLQYIINTLEQGFYTIVERVNSPYSSGNGNANLKSQTLSPPGAAPSKFLASSNSATSTSHPNSFNHMHSSSSSTSSTTSIKNESAEQSLPANTTTTCGSSASKNAIVSNAYSLPIRNQVTHAIINPNNHLEKKYTSSSGASQNLNSEQAIGTSTKIVYYTDKNVTPFLTYISKSIGKITLLDFKEMLKLKPNNYRFHFKTQDQEFGIVREEIANDNSILPDFEGRIIAWIQEFE